jgi:taurine dioxygenase
MASINSENTKISWAPIKENFGAEVDVDLNAGLGDSQIEDLRRLFDERHLLVFRNQKIDYDTQRKTVAIFGDLLPASGDAKYVSTVHDVEGNPVEKPRDIDPRAAEFHSDLTFMQAMPIRGISLFGEDVSDNTARVEGTRFVSARQAYLDLPESARAELLGRTSIHLHALGLSVEEQMGLRDRPFDEIKGKVDFWAEHPVFFPAGSSEPVLFYVPWFAHSIVGMSPAESRKWFALFDSVLYRDEDIYTHKWQQNDLVLWDNVALQHGKEPTAPDASAVPKRVLRRAIFGTEAPDIYKAGYSYDAERSKRTKQVG